MGNSHSTASSRSSPYAVPALGSVSGAPVRVGCLPAYTTHQSVLSLHLTELVRTAALDPDTSIDSGAGAGAGGAQARVSDWLVADAVSGETLLTALGGFDETGKYLLELFDAGQRKLITVEKGRRADGSGGPVFEAFTAEQEQALLSGTPQKKPAARTRVLRRPKRVAGQGSHPIFTIDCSPLSKSVDASTSGKKRKEHANQPHAPAPVSLELQLHSRIAKTSSSRDELHRVVSNGYDPAPSTGSSSSSSSSSASAYSRLLFSTNYSRARFAALTTRDAKEALVYLHAQRAAELDEESPERRLAMLMHCGLDIAQGLAAAAAGGAQPLPLLGLEIQVAPGTDIVLATAVALVAAHLERSAAECAPDAAELLEYSFDFGRR